jgi:hypothetical protein
LPQANNRVFCENLESVTLGAILAMFEITDLLVDLGAVAVS